MGMRKCMGYVQYTLLILIYMPVEKLIEMNIYPNPARSDHEAACSECLSWSGRAWSDVKDITEADEDHSNESQMQMVFCLQVKLLYIQLSLSSWR